jgi:transposase
MRYELSDYEWTAIKAMLPTGPAQAKSQNRVSPAPGRRCKSLPLRHTRMTVVESGYADLSFGNG